MFQLHTQSAAQTLTAARNKNTPIRSQAARISLHSTHGDG